MAAAIVILWGGYGHHWPWTGINGRTATLWDWLHLLLLPVAVGLLPIWLSRRDQLPRRQKVSGAACLGVFAVLVIAGYAIPWAWTGFTGNRLWEWLELLALPLAIALTPTFNDLRSSWCPRHTVIALTSLGVFAAIVIGGYIGDWTWTGFRGNTLWDRLHLLLLPLLIPTIVVPASSRWPQQASPTRTTAIPGTPAHKPASAGPSLEARPRRPARPSPEARRSPLPLCSLPPVPRTRPPHSTPRLPPNRRPP